MRKRRRQRQRPPSSLLFLLLLSSSLLLPVSAQITQQQCLIFLSASDSNRDDLLAREGEFPRFATVMSPNSYTTFASTPVAFQTIYNKYAGGPTGVLSVAGARTQPPPAQLAAMCQEFLQVLPTKAPVATPAPVPVPVPGPVVPSNPSAGSIVVPFTTCRVSMAVSDTNRDDQLSQTEWVTFLDRMTAGRRGYTSFAGLPTGLQSTFTTLSGGQAQLPIAGASPQSYGSATPAQVATLQNICDTTVAALNDGANAGTGPPTAPVAPPPPAAPAAMPLPQCRVSMALSDRSRDNQLDVQEYVTFVNRLTNNQYNGQAFGGLPPGLQQNYNTLAAATAPATTIGIAGAQPAEFNAATPEQQKFLERICVDTQAITVQLVATPAPVATAVPATAAPVASAPPGVTLLPFVQCEARMHGSDVTRDDYLNQDEYAGFVSRLDRAVNYPTFASLPPALQTNYANLAGPNGEIYIFGAVPYQEADATQTAFLEKICFDTQVAIGTGTVATVAPSTALPIVPLPPTYAPVISTTCGQRLTESDNGDSRLDQAEYAQFVWRMTNFERFAGYTYPQLPQVLQNNFATLSNDGGLSLDFSSSTAAPPGGGVTTEQLAKINAICTSTIAAINQYVIANATPAPTAAPLVITPLATCKAWLSNFDADNNFQLTQEEYTPFVNQMATSQPGGPWTPAAAFVMLPSNVQGVFGAAAPGGFVSIQGVNPAIPANAVLDQQLTTFCGTVDQQIYNAMYVGTPAPVAVSTPPPTPRPTVTFANCKIYMMNSEAAPGDNYLQDFEYLTFVNYMSQGLGKPPAGASFAALHPAIRQNFDDLVAIDISSEHGRTHYNGDAATGGIKAIDIYGSRPQNVPAATEKQNLYVQQVCLDTANVILDALAPPSPAPTPAPTISMAPTVAGSPTPAPTVFDGSLLIYNSFYIYNIEGLTAEILNTKDDSGEFENSAFQFQFIYLQFITSLVPANPYFPPATAVPAAAGRFLRKIRKNQNDRRLVALKPSSATIREFEDIECPPEVIARPQFRAAKCQKVLADYTVTGIEEGTQFEAQAHYELLTQTHMVPPLTPNLQADAARYNSPLYVYGATPTIEGYSPPPTMAPSTTLEGLEDYFDPSNIDLNDSNTILAVVMVGFLALIALLIYFAWNDKDKIKKKWREFKAKQRERDEDELAEGEEGYDEDGQKQGGENEDEEYNEGDAYADEYEEDYDVEDGKAGKKGKRAKKLLGNLGKGVAKVKNRVIGDNDDDDDLGFGFQDENLLDFEDYIFDTPAELLQEQNKNKFGDDGMVGKDGTHKRGGLLSTSVTSAGHAAPNMTDSVGSESDRSSMQGSDSDEDDFDDYGFEDEYDSDDSEEDEDEDSFELSMSDSGDENTISSKEDNGDGEKDADDDGSLSSSDEQGDAVVGGDVEGVLEAARSNGEEGGEGEDEDDDGSESGSSYYTDSTSSSHEARMAEYRNEVKELVAKVIPEELDNLSTMMDQFEGREAELINTLQNMEERTSTQRARAAVHKTKVKVNPNQVGGYSIASEGSAVIAAASTLGPEPQRRQPRVQQNYDDEYYDDDYYSDEGSYYSEGGTYYPALEDDGASYYSEGGTYYPALEDDGASYYSEGGTYYPPLEDEGSYYSEGGTYYPPLEDEGSYYSEGGTYYPPLDDDGYDDGSNYSDEEGSYFSGEEEGSYFSGEEEGSYDSQEEGGSFDDEGGSYDDEGSYYSGEEEEGSYDSQEGSYVSGEEEGSYYSGEEEGSYVSGEEGSFVSGEEGSYVSGEEGSYDSQEEGSYVSGEEEGSYFSGEDEEGSYYSQDEEGSYYSGEEDDFDDGSGSFDDRG